MENSTESFHSVTLSVDGSNYTANIWRGGETLWRVLSVDAQGVDLVEGLPQLHTSCQAALEAAERLAMETLLGSDSRAPTVNLRAVEDF